MDADITTDRICRENKERKVRMSLWENNVICFPLSPDLRISELEGMLETTAKPGIRIGSAI